MKWKKLKIKTVCTVLLVFSADFCFTFFSTDSPHICGKLRKAVLNQLHVSKQVQFLPALNRRIRKSLDKMFSGLWPREWEKLMFFQ